MAFLSANAYFKGDLNREKALIGRVQTAAPIEFLRLYKGHAAKMTPKGKTSYLRRSIITHAENGTAQVSWRAPYAMAQNDGGHQQRRLVRGPNQRDGGFGTIKPGFYAYTRNANFAGRAFDATLQEMPAVYRQEGFGV